MGKLFFTGGLNNMALDEAVHFFNRIVGDLFNVGVTSLAFNFGMHTLVKDVLVHVQQPEVAFFIHPAETRILVT